MTPASQSRIRERLNGLRLYVLITAELCRGDWLETARAAIAGGADCLQLREPKLNDAELLRRARQLRDVCHECGTLLVVNNRPDIARLVGADGVHLGQDDLPVDAVRRIVGPGCAVGLSTHSPEQARHALEQKPDYLAVGPMFESATKGPEGGRVAGPELLRVAAAMTDLPIVPIGGISGENVELLVAAGASRVAVCQAVIGQPDPRRAAAELRRRLLSAMHRKGH